jgi:putative adhesin
MTSQTEIRHTLGAGGTFVLRSASGSIRLAGGESDEIVVLARSTHRDLPDLNVERGPGRLLVEPPRIGFSLLHGPDLDIEFDVTLPKSARVDVKAVSADITVSGLDGEQDYKTVSGDLYFSGTNGRVSVLAVSGDVRFDGTKRLELTVTTTSGDIRLDGELFEYLRAKSVSGDVIVTGRVAVGPRHSVETVSGDLILRTIGGVTVEPARALDIGRSGRRPIVVGDGAAQLSFRSMSGEERVTMVADGPPAPAAQPDAPTSSYRTQPPASTRLDVLRALERGEIDVEEAARRLEEVSIDA